MSTRRDVRLARKIGRTRRGLDAILSSSRWTHDANIGGKETRKFADMSRASKVSAICGKERESQLGTAFGVEELPINRCVVPLKKL